MAKPFNIYVRLKPWDTDWVQIRTGVPTAEEAKDVLRRLREGRKVYQAWATNHHDELVLPIAEVVTLETWRLQ
mgnify:FL=1